MSYQRKANAGFTIVELLIVIAVVIVMAAALFVALNPAKRFAQARAVRRTQDVQMVLEAVNKDQGDNGGTYMAALASLPKGSAYMIGTAPTGCDVGCAAKPTQAACVNLDDLVTQGYLQSVPYNPDWGSSEMTGYYVMRDSAGVVEVGSCE